MIRWSYLLPRLAIVFALLIVTHFGASPLLRWALVRSLESTTGTEVEVDHVWASLTQSTIRIGALRVARDASSTTNVFQFDSAHLALDIGQLTHRRCVVDHAQIHGLQFNTPRTDAPADRPSVDLTAPDTRDLVRRGRRQTEQWLRQLAAVLEVRVEDEFDSIPLARELARRWPADYRQLEEEARQIRRSAIELHQAFTKLSAQSDAMSQIAELQRRWPEVSQLSTKIATLHQRAVELANQIQADRDAIDTALQHDRENLREKLRITQLDGQLLGDYLLNGEAGRWWRQLKPWLEVASWLTRTPDTNALGNRGRNVNYEKTAAQPGFLIRNAGLDGRLWLAGHQVDFSGQARHLTFLGQYGDASSAPPTELNLITRGPFTARILTRLDRVADAPRQQIVLRCDDLPVPARRWGAADSVQISVAPSRLQLQARLIATRGSLDGRFRITQQDVSLTMVPTTNAALAPLFAPLTAAAAKINRIDVLVDVSGTLDAPRWQLQTDLGRQLQSQLQRAAEQLVREQTERLLAEAQQRLDAELAQLQQQLASRQQLLQQQLNAGKQLLSGLPQPVASRLLPFGNLLRQ